MFLLNDQLLSFLRPVLSGAGLQGWAGSAHLSPKSEFQRGLGPRLVAGELGSRVCTVGSSRLRWFGKHGVCRRAVDLVARMPGGLAGAQHHLWGSGIRLGEGLTPSSPPLLGHLVGEWVSLASRVDVVGPISWRTVPPEPRWASQAETDPGGRTAWGWEGVRPAQPPDSRGGRRCRPAVAGPRNGMAIAAVPVQLFKKGFLFFLVYQRRYSKIV